MVAFSPRKSGLTENGVSPQNLCKELAQFVGASRDSREDAGLNAPCGTVSGNNKKFVPGIAGRLLGNRSFQDQTKVELA